MPEKPRPIRRAAEAQAIERQLKSIIKDLDKIPSFSGKAKFMDKVLKVHVHAHNLAWNLDYDASEEVGKA